MFSGPLTSFPKMGQILDKGIVQIFGTEPFEQVYGKSLPKFSGGYEDKLAIREWNAWQSSPGHFLELSSYSFIFNTHKNKDKVKGTEIIKRLFSVIDQIKEPNLNDQDKDVIKSSVLTSIASVSQAALENGLHTDENLKPFSKNYPVYPCFYLDIELARYISTPTTKRIWCHLQNKDDRYFTPTRHFNVEFDLSSLGGVKKTIKGLLEPFYKSNGKFLSNLSVRSHSTTDKTTLEKINNLVQACDNIEQIQNLFFCALNVAKENENTSCFSASLESKPFYQILLTGLKISKDFVPSQDLENKNLSEVKFKR